MHKHPANKIKHIRSDNFNVINNISDNIQHNNAKKILLIQ